MVLLAASLTWLPISSVAIAGRAAQFRHCKGVASPLDRLACFDAIDGGQRNSPPDVTQREAAGQWLTHSDVSPLDDSTNVYLSLDAENEIRARFESTRPRLVLRCKEKKTEGFVDFGTFLGTDTIRVTIRLDKQPIVSGSWDLSTDHTSAFIPGAVAFIRRLTTHRSLLVQVTPYGESTVMATFDLEGLDEALKPLRDACRWK